MIVFLRCPSLSVDIVNFKLILHVFSLLEVNSFGVANAKSQIRVGTGLYYPTNLLDHSCDPNAIAVFRDRKQFIIAIKPIKKGDPVNISYIDQAIESAEERKFVLARDYYFSCVCSRCQHCS